jgi:hypothetical protein
MDSLKFNGFRPFSLQRVQERLSKCWLANNPTIITMATTKTIDQLLLQIVQSAQISPETKTIVANYIYLKWKNYII